MIPSSKRLVGLAEHTSDGGMLVDSPCWSIHVCRAQKPLSPAAVRAHLSHTLWTGSAFLARPPWDDAVEWRQQREAGISGWSGAQCGRRSGHTVATMAVARQATIRLLYARCGRPLSELWLGQSRLCMGRAHAEPELHVGGYSPHIRRCAVFDEISSHSCPSVTSHVLTDV